MLKQSFIKRKIIFWLGILFIILSLVIALRKPKKNLISPLVNSSPSPEVETSPSPSPSPSISPSPSPTPTPTPKPSPSSSPSPSPSPSPTPVTVNDEQLNSWFTKYSSEYNVDEQLLKRIAQCESEMNPNASNGDYAGLFQFTSNTWGSTRIDMGLDSNADLRFNAEESIRTAAWKVAHGGQNAWPNCY